MELRRRRRSLGLAVLVIAAGLVGLFCAWGAVNPGSAVFYAVCGALALVLGAVLARDELRPFRFGIGEEGLALREGLVPWSRIERVVLDEPVPPASSGAHLVLQPGDRVVLKLDDVRQSREQIVEALLRYGGSRFEDVIAKRGARTDFAIVLRGYDPGYVDNLVRRATDALLAGGAGPRGEARAAIDEAAIPVLMRGYDREQVDQYLRRLYVRLGE